MATRRIAEGVFDHGAQYFSVRDPWFQKLVSQWQAEGVVKFWSDGFLAAEGVSKQGGSPHYRGAPGMTAIPKALAVGLEIHLACAGYICYPCVEGNDSGGGLAISNPKSQQVGSDVVVSEVIFAWGAVNVSGFWVNSASKPSHQHEAGGFLVNGTYKKY
jgi:hypothetical protein